MPRTTPFMKRIQDTQLVPGDSKSAFPDEAFNADLSTVQVDAPDDAPPTKDRLNLLARIRAWFRDDKESYNPNEPRDATGKWTKGSGAASMVKMTEAKTQVDLTHYEYDKAEMQLKEAKQHYSANPDIISSHEGQVQSAFAKYQAATMTHMQAMTAHAARPMPPKPKKEDPLEGVTHAEAQYTSVDKKNQLQSTVYKAASGGYIVEHKDLTGIRDIQYTKHKQFGAAIAAANEFADPEPQGVGDPLYQDKVGSISAQVHQTDDGKYKVSKKNGDAKSYVMFNTLEEAKNHAEAFLFGEDSDDDDDEGGGEDWDEPNPNVEAIAKHHAAVKAKALMESTATEYLSHSGDVPAKLATKTNEAHNAWLKVKGDILSPGMLAELGVKPEVVKPEKKSGKKSGHKTIHQKLKELVASHHLDGPSASKVAAAVIKVPPPPVTAENTMALSSYVSSSASFNMTLRNAAGDLSKLGPSASKSVKVLDKMMQDARDYAVKISFTRGLPGGVVKNLKVGDTFVDHAYMSTSFSKSLAASFGGNTNQMEITVPPGFKFLSVPSYASKSAGGLSGLAHKEAEAILPRGVGLKVKKIEKVNGKNVYHVEAVFSALQAPREKWESTKAMKLKANKAAK